MKIVATKHFLKTAGLLPAEVQNKLDTLLVLFAQNPFHPLLHTKRLKRELAQAFSFRISRDWRAIFVFEDKDTIKLVNVGNRKDIYR